MNCIYVDRINSLVVLRDHEFVEFNEIVVTFRIVICRFNETSVVCLICEMNDGMELLTINILFS